MRAWLPDRSSEMNSLGTSGRGVLLKSKSIERLKRKPITISERDKSRKI